MTKFQDENQLKGRFGELFASFVLPTEWVVRPILHDYGIDLEAEIFKEVTTEEDPRRKYQTWGEHVYFQVKTTDTLPFRDSDFKYDEIATISHTIDTAELKLVEAMGASVPVVLLLVDRRNMNVFYLCLTDYVAKVLAKDQPEWRAQISATVKVPCRNNLKPPAPGYAPEPHWEYLARLARRSKLYSAANLAHHYLIELRFELDTLTQSQEMPYLFKERVESFLGKLQSYTCEIQALDIWRKTDSEWLILASCREVLEKLKVWCTKNLEDTTSFAFPKNSAETVEERAFHFIGKASFQVGIFETLANVGRTYEQVERLERLPGIDPFFNYK